MDLRNSTSQHTGLTGVGEARIESKQNKTKKQIKNGRDGSFPEYSGCDDANSIPWACGESIPYGMVGSTGYCIFLRYFVETPADIEESITLAIVDHNEVRI